MASTAIGSVGEISAPNSRQSIKGSGRPSQGSTAQSNPPTAKVETAVPAKASSPTCRPRRRSRATSTCSAPANSSTGSMPCIRTAEKSMDATNACSRSRRPGASPSASRPARASDSAIEHAMTPIVMGSFSRRAFRQATSAVMARTVTAMSIMGAGESSLECICLRCRLGRDRCASAFEAALIFVQ